MPRSAWARTTQEFKVEYVIDKQIIHKELCNKNIYNTIILNLLYDMI